MQVLIKKIKIHSLLSLVFIIKSTNEYTNYINQQITDINLVTHQNVLKLNFTK